jgi:hypothetical protein
MECGACQHQAWEDAWKLKLDRARTFLAKIREKDMPGTQEVARLVQGLEEEYTIETWKTRNMFANVPKPRISRVQHTQYQKTPSKLKHEVTPENVIEKVVEKDWSELNEEDYDGDYVASEDPLHPVNTNYDTLWTQGYPGGCEEEHAPESEEHEGGTFNENDSGWDPGDGIGDGQNVAKVAHEKWQAEETTPLTIRQDGTSVTGWGPGAELSTSTSMLRIDNANAVEEHEQRIQQTIQTFWVVVNANSTNPHPPKADNTSDSTFVSESHHMEE